MKIEQQQVVDERAELLIKYNECGHFIRSPIFATISQREQSLLIRQHTVMWRYLDILNDRIKLFNGELK